MDRTVGLLGGGQLGQMLCEAANPLGVKVVILDAENSPAKQVNAKASHITGSFTDPEKIRELARQCDILTVEIEHVDTHVLEEIAEEGIEIQSADGKTTRKKVQVQPNWKTLRTIQDKFLQKEHLAKHGVETAVSQAVESDKSGLERVGKELGFPFMLKARKDAYDGRGNFPVMSAQDIPDALEALKGRGLYAEKWASFKMELAVMVVKTSDNTLAYPAVETIHQDSICKLVYCPPRGISTHLQEKAQDLARKAVGSMWGNGVFGVELFVMENDTIILNEIAPRPHNSGHYTIEACPTMSQYKSQLLSILDIMPSFPGNKIPSLSPATVMLNILGGASKTSHNALVQSAVATPSAALHMYGKESKPARKIGHITLVAQTMAEAEKAMNPMIALADEMRMERLPAAQRIAAKATSMAKSASKAELQPLVAVTMGSDSDLPVLKPGLALLETLGVPYFVTITSAHRTPARMTDFAANAAANGFKVIIAAAGGAAHLPGMIAASTALPVIGVPVKGSTLDGMDSLLSIVQMPRGVPVATVAINNSINAALLAARILGSYDVELRQKLERYAKDMESEVLGKAEKLEGAGWEKY
ncbi:phosphoribosylaminoimidazole carboxylase [Coleophoma crateriformis]|uniref:Phosphoribosylaminoimidazole carboxylase n=1 Tax=Coleophoma crateriformis TaxID=565419 RepID=A0A3D8RVH4_9HELO|nr:phosphoribosylaminoimidazole carboxylase [Coleophoma crateriformis]